MVAAYAMGGVAVGLASEPLNRLLAMVISSSGRRVDFGIMIAVNALFPAAIIALAVWHPRLWTIWLGSAVFFLAFTAARVGLRQPQFWLWTPQHFLNILNPIVIAAALASACLGSVAAFVVRPFRRVGVRFAPDQCQSCGYPVAGSEADRCPECGAAFKPDAAALDAVPR